MVQGASSLNKKSKKQVKNQKEKKVYNHKKTQSAKFTKRGNPSTEVRRNLSQFKATGKKNVTGFINQNIENVMAARAMQTGSKFTMKDIQSSGKSRMKEINQLARTKKKSRIEQKLEAYNKHQEKQEKAMEESAL